MILKMINSDDVAKENIKEHNPDWPQIPDHPCRILITASGKANSLFNLINHPKDPFEAKYQFLIKKREDVGTKHFNDYKASIEYSNDMDDIYKDIEE